MNFSENNLPIIPIVFGNVNSDFKPVSGTETRPLNFNRGHEDMGMKQKPPVAVKESDGRIWFKVAAA